jgi:hypothetical protein
MKSFLETRQLAAMCDEFFPVNLKWKCMSARSLVFMIKLLVWYFVSDTNKDMFCLFWLGQNWHNCYL